jgi:biopolymer transport protein ExbB/TolQ
MNLCKTGSIFYWHVLLFVVVELLYAARNENSLDIRDFVGKRSLSHQNECLISLTYHHRLMHHQIDEH